MEFLSFLQHNPLAWNPKIPKFSNMLQERKQLICKLEAKLLKMGYSTTENAVRKIIAHLLNDFVQTVQELPVSYEDISAECKYFLESTSFMCDMLEEDVQQKYKRFKNKQNQEDNYVQDICRSKEAKSNEAYTVFSRMKLVIGCL